jgi:putative ABC transport system permease protein
LTECLLAGLAAGHVGAIAGIAVVVVSARLRGWVPVVDPRLVVAAPLLGLASGVGAAVVPAWKAGRIEPAEALRR